MKAVFVLSVVALIGAAMGATRFQDQRCYEGPKTACRTSEMRKICAMTRWDCRERGVAVSAKHDAEFRHITGECDDKGPRVFCKDAAAARKCKADKRTCNAMGYWNFQ